MALEQAFLPNGEVASGIAFARDDFTKQTEYLMGTVHIWFWRHEGNGVEMLLQKRSLSKENHPGFWDISVAGHIDTGETALEAAVRECREEIGYTLQRDDLVLLFSHNNGDRIAHIYLCEAMEGFQPVFQDGEVDVTEWKTRGDFEHIVMNPAENHLVNHGKSYFTMLLEKINTL